MPYRVGRPAPLYLRAQTLPREPQRPRSAHLVVVAVACTLLAQPDIKVIRRQPQSQLIQA